MKNYKSARKSLWKGRDDGDRFWNKIKITSLDTLDKNAAKNSLSILGFAVEEGIRRNMGRVGAAKGPDVVRRSLGYLAYNSSKEIFDLGNVTQKKGNLESSQDTLFKIIKDLDSHIIVIGGGHELSFPQYKALSEKYREGIGIVNLDAHFDLRDTESGKGNSGSSFKQIADFCKKNNLPFNYFVYGIQKQQNTNKLFSVASSLNTEYALADDIFRDEEKSLKKLRAFIEKQKYIYISICVDVISQSFAPGVSARSSIGLFPWQVVSSLTEVAKSKKSVGFGIAEVSPKRDIESITANLVANLIAIYIEKLTLNTTPKHLAS